MTSHSLVHEAIVVRIVTGDLDRTSKVARDLATECEECRAELDAMYEVSAGLDAVGAFEREVLAEAVLVGDAPGLEEVQASMRKYERRAGPASPARWFTWLLAAAAVLVAGFGMNTWFGSGSGGDDDRIMGGGKRIEELAPSGEADFAVFRWSYALPEGGWFEVRVYSLAAGAVDPVGTSRKLTKARWRPRREEHESWPDDIRWEVEAFTAVGRLAGGAASARRPR